MARPVPLDVDTLRREVDEGLIDTVVVGITDMQGRMQGKRIHADHFVHDTLAHGTEGCNYLLAVDIDMNTVSGYAMSSWDSGYGDMVMRPDLTTLHRIPWQEGAVGVLCDVLREDGSDVVASPRQVLKRQTARLADAGMAAYVGTELEFIVFLDSYEEAWEAGYRDLTPANLYNVDYSILGGARVEPLLRRIRLGMAGAGLEVESAKGECNFGQHEIAFKYNEREGNSCHIHLSFRGLDGSMVMADDAAADGMSAAGRSFIAGQLAHMEELTLLFAPQINSYKRYVEGSFAPTAIKWGRDNRTCALRLVGHGASLRLENRVPGGDVNPYLATAGIIAAGLDGIERGLELEPAFEGNAYVADAARVPDSLARAVQLWEESDWVRQTFGEEVQAHYARMGRVELEAFGRAVTDWERYRGFERL